MKKVKIMREGLPKVSVIVPVFNCEKYLSRCIDSLLNQSLKNIEIIIVDDYSTDATTTIAKQYASNNFNVIFHKNAKNMGTGYSRNIGFNLSKGEYVAFLDADDWIDTNAYMIMTKNMDTTLGDIAVCGIKTEYSNIHSSTVRYNYAFDNTISGTFALHLLSCSEAQDIYISPMPGNKVIRRKFLIKNELLFPKRSFCEDDEFFFKAFYFAQNITIVPEVFQHYYQREDSSMHMFSKKHIDDFLDTFKELKAFLMINDTALSIWKDYYAFFQKCLFSVLNTLFSCEQQIVMQKKYLNYLFENVLHNFTVEEIIEHVDIQKLKQYIS